MTETTPVRKQTTQTGVTMIELLVTMSIAVIVMTLAVPSFMDFVRNSRLTNAANDLTLALAYARSEAVKRGVKVTVCSRASDAACSDTQSGSPARYVWDDGWLAFVDSDGDGTVDAGETILRAFGELDAVTVRTSEKRATFNNQGFAVGYNQTFMICDSRGVDNAKGVVLSAQGRVRSDSSGVTCPAA